MKKLLVLLLLVFGATILVACQKKWTVSFDVDGGTPKVESQIVFDGKYATEPTAPTKNGSVFQGWRAGNTDFDFANTQIKANITLTANWKDTTPVLSHESLNVSINYKLNDHVSTLSSISWVGNSPYVSSVDGLTYNKGDLLPVWKYISEKLNVDLRDVAVESDADTNSQWTRLEAAGFSGVDLVNGQAASIGAAGVGGKFVNLLEHLDKMPNLKKFFDENPSIKAALTSVDGHIYYTPYFDGLNEFEQAFLMRTDWVKDLLDGVSDDNTVAKKPSAYTRREIQVPIDKQILVATGENSTRSVNKKYSVNPLDVISSPSIVSGADQAAALKKHFSDTYGNQGYAHLSDVVIGADAAYDTDELVALMYVVKSNPKYLTRERSIPLEEVQVFFPRENAGNRIQNLIRATEMYGLKGMVSKVDFLYFDQQGLLQDARWDEKTGQAINDLNKLRQDNIIVDISATAGGYSFANNLISSANGFIEYDYNGSQTPAANLRDGKVVDPTSEWQSCLPPVVDWKRNGEYIHYTEFVRNGKSEVWGIPSTTVGPKLDRALMLVDQLYDMSTRDSIGTVHLYGPAAFGDELLYTSPTGVPVYKLNDATRAEMAHDPADGQPGAKGNHINYLRRYLGATMPIGHVRDMGLEYQTLSDQGVIGYEKLTTAVKAGAFLLGGVSKQDDMFFHIPGIAFALTAADTTYIAQNFKPITDRFGSNGYIGLINNGLDWAEYKSLYTTPMHQSYIAAYRAAYQLATK